MTSMPVPADKLSAIRDRLANPMVAVSELEVRRTYKELLELHTQGVPRPMYGLLYLTLGNVATRMEKHDEALKWFRLGVQAEPTDPGYLSNMALALQSVGRPQDALEALVRASELPTGQNSLVLGNLASHLVRVGLRNDAIELWREAVRLADHNSTSDMLQMAQSAGYIGLEDEALRFAARAISLHFGVSWDGHDAVAFLAGLPTEYVSGFSPKTGLPALIRSAVDLRSMLPELGHAPAHVISSDAAADSEDESLRVFKETRPLRRRATQTVIGEHESAEPPATN